MPNGFIGFRAAKDSVSLLALLTPKLPFPPPSEILLVDVRIEGGGGGVEPPAPPWLPPPPDSDDTERSENDNRF